MECNERHGHIQYATDISSYRSYAIFLTDALATVRDETGHRSRRQRVCEICLASQSDKNTFIANKVVIATESTQSAYEVQ